MKPNSLNFGDYEKPEPNTPVPSSVTLLVSLFLILVTFFIVMNRNNEYDQTRKDAVIKSVQNKFGLPTNESINFGTIIPPKVEDFVMELEKLFQTNALVTSTINGEETTITASKKYFYYDDETSLRQDKTEMLLKLQDILDRWGKSAKLKISFTLSLQDYKLDNRRLENFRRTMAQPDIDVGLDTKPGDKFVINIKYD